MNILLPMNLLKEVSALGVPVNSTYEEGLEPDTFSIDIRMLDRAKLDELYEYLKRHPAARSARIHINSYKKGRDAPRGAAIETFRAAAGAITDYIVDGAIEGWLFKIDDNPIPALLTDVEYFPPVRKRDYEREAYISISMIQNDRGKSLRLSGSIEASSAAGLTVAEMLEKMGWQKETPELHELYQEQLVRYKVIRPMYGKQLVLLVPRSYTKKEDDGYGFSSTRRHRKKQTEINLMLDNVGRVVHDDPIGEGQFGVRTYRYDDPDNPYISGGLQALIERHHGKDAKVFNRAPFYMVINVYHLGQHTEFTAHVKDLEIYKYDESIRQKLILPELYNEVLDVLTHDMLLVQDDIVVGKSGGNVVLLAGPPGLGKTLTAEVYAEFRKVPLLKIHSGQLGIKADEVEDSLTGFYKRANAWGIPILLDEFDVFGRARGDSLAQNAVVAVFLRTLEYQNNTIFLTTNRADDMDDAILNRCAAIIKYEYPKGEELKGIWKTQRDQFLKSLPDEQIDELMLYFETHQKQMAGRDVKNIMRLADRYERTGRKVDVELMKTCAGFRGV